LFWNKRPGWEIENLFLLLSNALFFKCGQNSNLRREQQTQLTTRVGADFFAYLPDHLSLALASST